MTQVTIRQKVIGELTLIALLASCEAVRKSADLCTEIVLDFRLEIKIKPKWLSLMGILKGLVLDKMMGTMGMGKGMMRRMVASQWFKDSYNKARMLLGSGMIALDRGAGNHTDSTQWLRKRTKLSPDKFLIFTADVRRKSLILINIPVPTDMTTTQIDNVRPVQRWC